MSFITRNCLQCSKQFNAPTKEVKRGNGKFCSRACCMQYVQENRYKWSIAIDNVVCALCGKNFHISESKKKNSKSGLYFCCRAHKDEAQKIGGIKAIMPPHFGTAQPDDNKHYRRLVFGTKPKQCERCGYNTNEAAIVVHHKDRNRMNDSLDNLEVLCANCHAIEHWAESTNAHLPI